MGVTAVTKHRFYLDPTFLPIHPKAGISDASGPPIFAVWGEHSVGHAPQSGPALSA
jgi:hypothetical protein